VKAELEGLWGKYYDTEIEVTDSVGRMYEIKVCGSPVMKIVKPMNWHF